MPTIRPTSIIAIGWVLSARCMGASVVGGIKSQLTVDPPTMAPAPRVVVAWASERDSDEY